MNMSMTKRYMENYPEVISAAVDAALWAGLVYDPKVGDYDNLENYAFHSDMVKDLEARVIQDLEDWIRDNYTKAFAYIETQVTDYSWGQLGHELGLLLASGYCDSLLQFHGTDESWALFEAMKDVANDEVYSYYLDTNDLVRFDG